MHPLESYGAPMVLGSTGYPSQVVACRAGFARRHDPAYRRAEPALPDGKAAPCAVAFRCGIHKHNMRVQLPGAGGGDAAVISRRQDATTEDKQEGCEISAAIG